LNIAQQMLSAKGMGDNKVIIELEVINGEIGVRIE